MNIPLDNRRDIVTAEVIRDLHQQPLAYDRDTLETIDVLCTKISGTYGIRERYLSGWKPIEHSQPLAIEDQVKLLAVLLRVAALHVENDTALRGIALKSLNAAFIILRNAPQGVTPLAEMRAEARALAASIR
jgi:hypothetical protein